MYVLVVGVCLYVCLFMLVAGNASMLDLHLNVIAVGKLQHILRVACNPWMPGPSTDCMVPRHCHEGRAAVLAARGRQGRQRVSKGARRHLESSIGY